MDQDCARAPDPPACAFCGEPERLSIHDIWTDSNFVLETCCPALLESVSAEMDADPAWGRELLRRLGAEELTGHRLRRVGDGAGCHPMLDWQLVLRPIRFAEARAFIAEHHVHCPPPVIIWTACILGGAPGSLGLPSKRMERPNSKSWHPEYKHRGRLSSRGDRPVPGASRCVWLLAEHGAGVSF